MSSDRLERAAEVLLLLLEAPEQERAQILSETCGADEELRREVASLLVHHDQAFLAGAADGAGVLVEAVHERLERLGPYRILRVLGRGGMGVVYEAEQDFPRRTVALKVIRADLLGDELARSFRREAQVLALLQHAGIAQIFAAGRAHTAIGTLPYIAMECVNGQAIDRHAREHSLGVEQRIALVVEACEAVAHAHQRGIVHRDLKPANLLVDQQGRVKVLDFGVARLTQVDHKLTTLQLGTGVVVGTLPYMSPEQASGAHREVDVRSDVYSLGVVLHELVAGRTPLLLDELPLHRAIEVIRHQPVEPLRRALPGADRDLETILLKTLEKEKERRYWSVEDLAADLRRYLRREPIAARPPTVWYQARRFSQRNRALVLGLAAVALTLLVGATIAGIGFFRASQRARQVLQLSAVARLRQLEQQAALAWPATPERIPEYRAWLEEAGVLEALRPEHERALAELPERAPDSETRWWRDSLVELLAALDQFQDPDPFVGALASVRERLGWAGSLRRRSLEEPARRWQEALDSIADPRECPAYGGLRIPAQIGLVPLARNPDSGLWEFAHLASGAPPSIGPGGRVLPLADSGIVLVLVPGGRYLVGAQVEAADRPLYDPRALGRERAVHEVELEPFFLSKFELTQAQWLHARGANPSVYYAGKDFDDALITLVHPVENVSWGDCADVLMRLGLDFPTEVQWEVAARARATTAWSTGAEVLSLEDCANIADATARRSGGSEDWPFVDEIEDGFVRHAPVGSLRGNPFGLHDVHGNVAEWCKDPRPDISVPPRPGDGLWNVDSAQKNRRIARGGSFAAGASDARLAARRVLEVDSRSDDVGLRPARRLDRP